MNIYCASWIFPITAEPIAEAAIAVEGELLVRVGTRASIVSSFPEATVKDFGEAAIIPGFVNCHTHLELTAMRGFLDKEETNFFAWLRKLTLARLEQMTMEDLFDSAVWGACEAARAGITSVGDSSDSGATTLSALNSVGLRGIVFQESFGPDPRTVNQNVASLKEKIARLRELQSPLVQVGISPHAPYTVSAPQLEMTADFAITGNLPLMMHAAESPAEKQLLLNGSGVFAEGLAKRGIDWTVPGVSTIAYLKEHRILEARPLLAHCINVDQADIEMIAETDTRVAHCPRSNAKLGHGRAPLAAFLNQNVRVGLGSDSVASNNSSDLLAEARFAILLSRMAAENSGGSFLGAEDALRLATLGGACSLSLDGRIGELRAGLQADFTVVSLGGAHQIPSYSPADTLIFASSGHDVAFTAIAGREIYADGKIQTVDEERLGARMREIARKLEA
jgi:cytosine/adenosine deaminase-related metal-dependent hydrolase